MPKKTVASNFNTIVNNTIVQLAFLPNAVNFDLIFNSLFCCEMFKFSPENCNAMSLYAIISHLLSTEALGCDFRGSCFENSRLVLENVQSPFSKLNPAGFYEKGLQYRFFLENFQIFREELNLRTS